MSVCGLVDVFDVGGIPTDESFPEVDKGAFYGFRVSFEGSFTPSYDALRIEA
jgi:hypothetical protein